MLFNPFMHNVWPFYNIMHERINPDRAKPAWKVIFSQKTKNITYPNLYLNNLTIVKSVSQTAPGNKSRCKAYI